MKNINKKSSSPRKKIAIILVAIALLSLSAIAVYAKFYSDQNSDTSSNGTDGVNQVNLDKPSDEQKEAGDAQKQNTADAANSNEGQTNDTLGVTITAFNQNGSQVQIRTLIDELSTNGMCTLTLKNDKGLVVTKTSDIQAQPNSSSCKGFDIPTSELGAGTWEANISVTVGTQTGTASKTLTIQ